MPPTKRPPTWHAPADCEFRSVLDRIGDKWTLLVVLTLEQAPQHRRRFSELKRGIPGISQRMLTTTLRHLERDGFVRRHYFPEVPPRIEYDLTPLGRGLLPQVRALVVWMQDQWPTIQQARQRFDRAHPAGRLTNV